MLIPETLLLLTGFDELNPISILLSRTEDTLSILVSLLTVSVN
jgi:hypothetical protein